MAMKLDQVDKEQGHKTGRSLPLRRETKSDCGDGTCGCGCGLPLTKEGICTCGCGRHGER
jgi:hypothetical protein